MNLKSEVFTPSDLWMAGVTALACIVLVVAHMQFRSGHNLSTGPILDRPVMRDIKIRMGYAALPGAVVMGLATPLVVALVFTPELRRTPLLRFPVIAMAFVMIGFGGWLIKEFFLPSPGRTPDWLANDDAPSPWDGVDRSKLSGRRTHTDGF